MKWLWQKIKSIPLLGWILAGVAGVLAYIKFSGSSWWERKKARKAIEREKVAIEKERQEYHETVEDERRADHDACIFDD